MALPNGYEYANVLFRDGGDSTSPYFDLGFPGASNLDMTMLFLPANGDANMFVFGARQSNSTSSAGQYNLLFAGSSTSYLGYAGARLSLGTSLFIDRNILIQKEAEGFTLNCGNDSILELTGATTSFTGTRNLYLFALNNAGTPNFGNNPTGRLLFGYISFSQNGEKVHELYPVYDFVNNKQCIYDKVTDTIISESGSGDWTWEEPRNITHRLLTIESDEGGYAYARTKAGLEVTKLYCSKWGQTVIGENLNYYGDWYGTTITAYEKNGYAFLGWEKDGEIVSTEKQIPVTLAEDVTLRARFKKKNDDEPKNQCQLMCWKYGGNAWQQGYRETVVYTPVISASIKFDGVSKTTSTIKVKEVPEGVSVNSIVVLINPRGEFIYTGVIKSIVDDTLSCREPLSLFDADFLFTSTKNSTISAMSKLGDYISSFGRGFPSTKNAAAERNASVERMMENAGGISISTDLSIDPNSNLNITAPVIESTNVANLEDHLLKQFDDFGIYIKTTFDWVGSSPGWEIRFVVTNPKSQEPLTLSNNNEALTDVTVDVQDMENTSLVVYDSTGATFKGIYSVKYDGTITNYNYPPTDETSFVAYDSCKPKIVMTDDNIKTVVEQYLSNAKYNHKITFNLDLDSDLYSLDALNIGRRVEFYYKNKVYQSIVTGLEWELPENTEDPHSVKVILGKVRNKLTTKINLGKVKK